MRGINLKFNRFAFTLAEVLITLGIIGVVAALTIPTIVEKYQKKVFATRVKQTYNIVSNALISSIQENGVPNTWDYGDSVVSNGGNNDSTEHIEQMVAKYFLPYFKSASYQDSLYGCYIKLVNGTTLTFRTDGKKVGDIYTPTALYIIASFNGKTSPYWSHDRNYSREDLIMVVGTNTTDASRLRFFKWNGSADNDRDKIKSNSQYGCKKEIPVYNRFNCGALIQYDGWKVAPDYPW